MGRGSRRLPIFCPNRLSTRVRVQPPRTETKTAPAAVGSGGQDKTSGCGAKQGAAVGKRIMVVVDSSREAKAAVHWALSHAVQSNDTIVLLDVVKPLQDHGDGYEKERNAKSYGVLYAMRKFCQAKKSEVKVELSLVQGKERGPTIVNESRRQGASLLVLGQRKQPATWQLLLTVWAGSRKSEGVAEYCIRNANCMTLAVRRKGRRGSGYMITSRRHKDFWLLA